VDRDRLVRLLDEEFGGNERALRTVSRQARDLADSGRIGDAIGYELTEESVVANLQDAPSDHSLIERWNWWIGSLELAYGGKYQRFRVREDVV
jgi:hypothetical protein